MGTRNEKNIIVSADDFGISRLANENILRLVRKSKLDRVEVMVSKNLSQGHVKELLESGVGLDIHLHLAKDQLDHWQNNPRKIETGAVKRVVLFLFHYFFGDTRPRIVEKEWESQIVEFQKLFGKNPDGISSHEHIHFFPAYFRVILRLSEKFNIPYVRFGKYPAKEKGNVCRILNTLRKMDYPFFKKSKLASSDFMVSFDWAENLGEIMKKYPGEMQVEVIFHPEKENELKVLEN